MLCTLSNARWWCTVEKVLGGGSTEMGASHHCCMVTASIWKLQLQHLVTAKLNIAELARTHLWLQMLPIQQQLWFHIYKNGRQFYSEKINSAVTELPLAFVARKPFSKFAAAKATCDVRASSPLFSDASTCSCIAVNKQRKREAKKKGWG